MFIIIAIIGYLLLALVFILDKFLVSSAKLKPSVYTFYSTIFMLAILLVYPFGVGLLESIDWLWALVSGVSFGTALYFFYLSLEKGETTHLAPFNGAVIAIATYAMAALLLGERLTSLQTFGIVILVLASFLFSFERSRENKGVHIGFLWAGISGVLFAISHITAKYLYTNYDFLTGFVWSRATTGIIGLVLLFSPVVWTSIKQRAIKKKKKIHAMHVVVTDKVLGGLAMVLIQMAAALGSVTIVFALSGLQFAFLFVLIILLSKLTPKLFKEFFTGAEIAVQSTAILLVIAGTVMLAL